MKILYDFKRVTTVADFVLEIQENIFRPTMNSKRIPFGIPTK